MLRFGSAVPEGADDGGAGDQSDERQAVTQSGQDLDHSVEDQLRRNTQTSLYGALNEKQ